MVLNLLYHHFLLICYIEETEAECVFVYYNVKGILHLKCVMNFQ
jgi:hypothetical protein